MSDYSKIIKKLKEIDWAPMADKAMTIMKSRNSDELDELSDEDRMEYEASLREITKLTLVMVMADESEKAAILLELGFVRLAMESLEARNELFSYRKTIELIGDVLAATIMTAISLA